MADLLELAADDAHWQPKAHSSRSRPAITTRKKKSTSFPKVERLFDAADLEALGDTMRAKRGALQAERPVCRRPAPADLVHPGGWLVRQVTSCHARASSSNFCYKRLVVDLRKDATSPLVVIVGGGFGGLAAARALEDAPVRVLLVDRTNHHLFQPLLYQVATSQLSPADIAKPIRSILRDQKNALVSMSLVKEIVPDAREVVTNGRRIQYDHLIVAGGARHSYFGKEGWEAHAPGLKSLGDAIEVRRRVVTAFEQAEKYDDEAKKRSALTFVVVGAGPTGVETAGAIAELAHNTLKADFRNIDPPRETRVILVEAGPRVLPSYTQDLSDTAREQLEKKLHVEVRLGTRVTDVGDRYVELDGVRLEAHTVIWAAGNEASPLARQLGADVDRMGRVIVSQDLTIPGHPEIQAIGDMVFVKDRKGNAVPGVAPAAMQMGRHAARNVLRQLASLPPEPFWYVDKGSLATIGRNAGIADVRGFRFGGWPAWLAWAVIHLFFLVGFRNRILVFFQWAWAYLFYTRAARLISDIPVRPDTAASPPTDAPDGSIAAASTPHEAQP